MVCWHKYDLLIRPSFNPNDEAVVLRKCRKCGKKKVLGEAIIPGSYETRRLRDKIVELRTRYRALDDLETIMLEKGVLNQVKVMHDTLKYVEEKCINESMYPDVVLKVNEALRLKL